MKTPERQDLSIKCQCIVTRNDIQLNGKKKSKFSLISLDQKKKILAVTPFGSQKQEQTLVFSLTKLKTIHKKYIEEGKITIQFIERTEKLQVKGVDVSAIDQNVQINSTILISSASKENLQLMINKIVQTVKQQRKSENKMLPNAQNTPSARKSLKKQPIQIENSGEVIKNENYSRKQLMKSVSQPFEKQKIVSKKTVNISNINLFDLPTFLIDSIFEYCQLSLRLRLINKKFSQYVLKNIISIKLKDQIDENTFNKLCKWAINVECKMKNVKNIELMDKYQQQQLKKDRAKTLKLGEWKEISAKNIMQLKGLRIYCLQVPYHIKFDFSNFYGLRLVELRMKSNTLNAKNDHITSQSIAYILKTIKDIRVLQLPFANSDLFSLIQNPKRLQELTIYFLADNSKEDNWTDLKKFEHLKSFSLWYIQKQGVKKENHEINMSFPQSLQELQVGPFLSNQSLQLLPQSLQYLKLIGQNYFNSHIQIIILPNLKELDITMSRNIRQQALECMQNLSIVTNWEKHTVQYLKDFASARNIRLTTVNSGYK